MTAIKQAWVFPGMAMQSGGMGKDLLTYPAAREVYQEVDDALDFKLSTLMFSDDSPLFQRMEHKQPALLTVSMAVLRVLEMKTGGRIWDNVDCVAGHSFGEFTALCATGALELKDTVRLMRDNARNMDQSQILKQGKMMVLIKTGLTIEEVQPIVDEAAQGQVCIVANDNGIGHIVVSGHNEAIDRVEVLAAERKWRRYEINRGVPAHSPLMDEAVLGIRDAFRQLTIRKPRIDFITNGGEVENDPHIIRSIVPGHVALPVRWREVVRFMCNRGVGEFIEPGPCPALLTGMIGRIAPEGMPITALDTPKAIDAFLIRL